MTPQVKNGQLSPVPKNAAFARKRALQLAADCARIEDQLNDGERMVRVTTAHGSTHYAEWRRKAEHVLRMRNMELRLLSEWLEQQGANMLRKARDLLLTLVDDECDFDEDELAFIFSLDKFVNGAGNSAG